MVFPSPFTDIVPIPFHPLRRDEVAWVSDQHIAVEVGQSNQCNQSPNTAAATGGEHPAQATQVSDTSFLFIHRPLSSALPFISATSFSFPPSLFSSHSPVTHFVSLISPLSSSKRSKGKRRKKWQPLSMTAVTQPSPVSPAHNNSQFDRPAFGETIVPAIDGTSPALGSATSPLPSAPYINDLQQLVRPPQDTNIGTPEAVAPDKPKKKNKRCRKKNKKQTDTMGKPVGYVPPHLRGRNRPLTPDASPPPAVQKAPPGVNGKEEQATGYVSLLWPQTDQPYKLANKIYRCNGKDATVGGSGKQVVVSGGTVSTKPIPSDGTPVNGPQSPPSPPSSPINDQVVCPNPADFGWGLPEANQVAQQSDWKAPASDEGKKWAQRKNNQNGRGKPPHKKYQWPKNRDMKAQPHDEEEEGGAELSNSNSNGDPYYDVRKLMDWAGNWAPAPIDWESRKGFTDRNFGANIEAWMNIGLKYKMDINTDNVRFLSEPNGDVAPDTWIPLSVEGASAQQFWRTFRLRAPEPVDEGDLEESPWWEKHQDSNDGFLQPLLVPDATMDPSDSGHQAYLKDHGSNGFIKKREEDRLRARRNAEKRRKKAAARARCPDPYDDEPVIDRRIYPKANIYLRPAYAQDIRQITNIYNNYVKTSVETIEFNPRPAQFIENKLNAATNAGIPFIVAIERGRVPQYMVRQPTYCAEEKVVGYAALENYGHPGSIYRFTFDLEVFVHPQYLHMGIGKCLLDRMLTLVDGCYLTRGGPDWIFRGDYLRYGFSQTVKTLVLSLPHDQGNDDKLNCVSALLKEFGFHRSGHMSNMGYKYGKVYVPMKSVLFMTSLTR